MASSSSSSSSSATSSAGEEQSYHDPPVDAEFDSRILKTLRSLHPDNFRARVDARVAAGEMISHVMLGFKHQIRLFLAMVYDEYLMRIALSYIYAERGNEQGRMKSGMFRNQASRYEVFFNEIARHAEYAWSMYKGSIGSLRLSLPRFQDLVQKITPETLIELNSTEKWKNCKVEYMRLEIPTSITARAEAVRQGVQVLSWKENYSVTTLSVFDSQALLAVCMQFSGKNMQNLIDFIISELGTDPSKMGPVFTRYEYHFGNSQFVSRLSKLTWCFKVGFSRMNSFFAARPENASAWTVNSAFGARPGLLFKHYSIYDKARRLMAKYLIRFMNQMSTFIPEVRKELVFSSEDLRVIQATSADPPSSPVMENINTNYRNSHALFSKSVVLFNDLKAIGDRLGIDFPTSALNLSVPRMSTRAPSVPLYAKQRVRKVLFSSEDAQSPVRQAETKQTLGEMTNEDYEILIDIASGQWELSDLDATADSAASEASASTSPKLAASSSTGRGDEGHIGFVLVDDDEEDEILGIANFYTEEELELSDEILADIPGESSSPVVSGIKRNAEEANMGKCLRCGGRVHLKY